MPLPLRRLRTWLAEVGRRVPPSQYFPWAPIPLCSLRQSILAAVELHWVGGVVIYALLAQAVGWPGSPKEA